MRGGFVQQGRVAVLGCDAGDQGVELSARLGGRRRREPDAGLEPGGQGAEGELMRVGRVGDTPERAEHVRRYTCLLREQGVARGGCVVLTRSMAALGEGADGGHAFRVVSEAGTREGDVDGYEYAIVNSTRGTSWVTLQPGERGCSGSHGRRSVSSASRFSEPNVERPPQGPSARSLNARVRSGLGRRLGATR